MKKNSLLEIAKEAALEALDSLELNNDKELISNYDEDLIREMKSEIDVINNEIILSKLKKTDIPILSEESPADVDYEDYFWIVDPLDGTVNYVRKIASCAISIALFKNRKPIFGVIAEYPGKNLYWGGKEFGAFKNKVPVKVSKISNKKEAILCTGFPARYNFDELDDIQLFREYAKIRMLGSAAISLVNLAKGSVDCYLEKNIMIWDIAAGMALLEGAGGDYKIQNLEFLSPVNLIAHNGILII